MWEGRVLWRVEDCYERMQSGSPGAVSTRKLDTWARISTFPAPHPRKFRGVRKQLRTGST
eukprot:7664032-Pyramimonas_sp.AAC.1